MRKNQAFQMPGWGMFVPEKNDLSEKNITICFAIKRQKTKGDGNDSDSRYWHTERQIVDHLLKKNEWKSPGEKGDNPIGDNGIKGTMYIYTLDTPCGTPDSDYEKAITCVDYHCNLQSQTEIKNDKIKLKIYAQKVTFSVKDFTKANKNGIDEINKNVGIQTAIQKGFEEYLNDINKGILAVNSCKVLTLPILSTQNITWNANATASNWGSLMKNAYSHKYLSFKNKFDLFSAMSGIEVKDCFDRQ